MRGFRCVPQSEHQEHAYVEDVNGVFAKFYGPNANRNMQMFITTYVYGGIKPDHYYCTECGADLGYGDPDHKCSGRE